ncbi:MAG: DUF493 domain-containing protein [Proteobacteria bacterium]|nr:DUF493 domain-containing protein [Pseudomonadota bacterium]
MSDSKYLEAEALQGTEEEILKFPVEIAIKAMGRSSDGFASHVGDLVGPHVVADKIISVTTRPSKAGNFTSVTVRIMADSREQLDTIYYALTDSDEVLMAL